jgi:hypothetical protein
LFKARFKEMSTWRAEDIYYLFIYLYIHEKAITRLQAFARAYHHWRILIDVQGMSKTESSDAIELKVSSSQGPLQQNAQIPTYIPTKIELSL